MSLLVHDDYQVVCLSQVQQYCFGGLCVKIVFILKRKKQSAPNDMPVYAGVAYLLEPSVESVEGLCGLGQVY